MTDNTNDKLKALTNFLGNIFGIATFGAIGVIFFFAYHFWQTPISKDPSMWGALGDYLGGILNPFFSFFALLALLLTLKIQSQELHLSREEMALTRRELEGSKEALNKQNFETTFFNMLRTQRDIINTIHVVETNRNVDFFLAQAEGNKPVHRDHKGISHICQLTFSKLEQVSSLEGLIENAHTTSKEYVSELSHYFKSLKALISYVDKTPNIDREFYISLIESHLTSPELVLIFLQGIQELEFAFKNQIEKYGLLRNLDMAMFYELGYKPHLQYPNFSDDMCNLYSTNAYKEPTQDNESL